MPGVQIHQQQNLVAGVVQLYNHVSWVVPGSNVLSTEMGTWLVLLPR